VQADADPRALTARIDDPAGAAEALGRLARAGIPAVEFSLGQPSLDEVFFALTGHAATVPEEAGKEMAAP
jgi:ABC-2 type transport system ATP-binding protein